MTGLLSSFILTSCDIQTSLPVIMFSRLGSVQLDGYVLVLQYMQSSRVNFDENEMGILARI